MIRPPVAIPDAEMMIIGPRRAFSSLDSSTVRVSVSSIEPNNSLPWNSGRISGERSRASDPVDVERSARHRAVDEDRQVRDVTRPDERSRCQSTISVRSTANDGMSTTPPCRAARLTTSAIRSSGSPVGVVLVAVRRLGDDDVGGADRRRRQQERMGRSARDRR